MGRYLKTRDSSELDATMRRLDAEQVAAAATSGAEPLSPEEVVAYLSDLPRLWRDASPEARQLIAASGGARAEVRGGCGGVSGKRWA